jgi:hypothetical protein
MISIIISLLLLKSLLVFSPVGCYQNVSVPGLLYIPNHMIRHPEVIKAIVYGFTLSYAGFVLLFPLLELPVRLQPEAEIQVLKPSVYIVSFPIPVF